MARPPGYYTLQVATAENDAQLRKFMQERPTGEARASLSMRQRNRTLLPVFQGVYPDPTSAAAALRQWQRGGTVAFIRRFDSLQRIIGQRTGQDDSDPDAHIADDAAITGTRRSTGGRIHRNPAIPTATGSARCSECPGRRGEYYRTGRTV